MNRRMNYTGRKIKQLRIACGLTQEELADRMYCVRSAISKLETGLRDPSFQEIENLCRILACTPNDLFPPETCEQLTQYYLMANILDRLTPRQREFMRLFLAEGNTED